MKAMKRLFTSMIVANIAFSSFGVHTTFAEEIRTQTKSVALMDVVIDEEELEAMLKAIDVENEGVLQEALALVEQRENPLLKGSFDTSSFVTRDEVRRLTEDDFIYLYDFIITDNPGEYELVQEMKKIANERGSSNNLHRSFLTLNWQETALTALYPAHGIAYAAQSIKARDAALKIYTDNSTWFDGNGDAYRHVIWNVYLYNAFNSALAVVNGLSGTREARVKLFTDAHEAGGSSIESDMDLRNNILGLSAAPTWLNSTQAVEVSTERFIDMGAAWRIQDWGRGKTLVATDNSEKRR